MFVLLAAGHFLLLLGSNNTYSIRPKKKTNLGLDVTYSSTTNLDRGMSRFVVLGDVTSSTRLVFYGTEGVVLLGFKKHIRFCFQLS